MALFKSGKGALMGGAIGGIPGALLGATGMFDAQEGQQAGNPFAVDPESLKQMESRANVAGNNKVAQTLAGYNTGNYNLADAIASLKGSAGGDPGALNQALSMLATDPMSGSKFATEQVQNNAILGQLFGKGGTLDRTNLEEQQLASRGYSLQPEDYEAYGQMSGQLARDFDRAESGLAQALSNRGLSASGVAGKQFMTSQGSKLEQLAGLQRQIANDRMNMNLQRLGQTRNFLSQLGNQGQQAIQDQYGRQLAGRQQAQQELRDTTTARQQQQAGLAGQYNEQFAQNQATKNSGLQGALRRGVLGVVEAGPTMVAKGALSGGGGA